MTDFEKELIKNGYKEFNVPPFEQYASKFYQKTVRDKERITKYFIDCYVYEYTYEYTYRFDVYIETGLCCIKTEFYGFAPDNLDLEKIENKIEEMYQGIGDKLYEHE